MEKDKTTKAALPFGNVLTKLMKERGLSPAQISALAGVSRSVVGDWLSGAAPRDLAAVGKLARALGISLRELLLDELEEEKSVAAAELADPMQGFFEQPFVDGVFRVTLHRLVPKKPA